MSIRDLGSERRSEVLADLGKYQIEFPSNELITASVHLRLLFRNRPLSFQDLFVASSALALGFAHWQRTTENSLLPWRPQG